MNDNIIEIINQMAEEYAMETIDDASNHLDAVEAVMEDYKNGALDMYDLLSK